MVFDDSTSKDMKQILFERGVNTTKMKADEMRKALQEFSDFKYEKTQMVTLLQGMAFTGYFIPKFHCEFNPT